MAKGDKTCSICPKPNHSGGYCSKHWSRFRRHGDPMRRTSEIWILDVARKRMFHNAKGRAKRKGIPFSLKASDVEIPSHCPVLGIALKHGDGKFCDSSPSLDRIKPELGYVSGNVRVISWRANRIKNDSTTEELEKIVRYMRS